MRARGCGDLDQLSRLRFVWETYAGTGKSALLRARQWLVGNAATTRRRRVSLRWLTAVPRKLLTKMSDLTADGGRQAIRGRIIS